VLRKEVFGGVVAGMTEFGLRWAMDMGPLETSMGGFLAVYEAN
jgi:hypothetical protein